MTFDPSKYLTKVGSSDYLEVKWRLVWLREDHPDAQIYTECLDHSPGQGASFKAHIVIPGGGSADGHGTEDSTDFRDYYEKAETKALGRALAALGYGTQFCPDFDFGAAAGKVVDSPVARTTTAPDTTNSGGQTSSQKYPPSEPQLKMIYAIGRKTLDMSEEELHQFAGVASLNDLDKRGASALIDKLKALEADGGVAEHDIPPDDGEVSNWGELWQAGRKMNPPVTNQAEFTKRVGRPTSDFGTPKEALQALLTSPPF